MKTVVITGGAKGIGRACAEYFGSRGYAVCVDFLSSESSARELISSLRERGADADLFRADVSDPAQAAALCDFVMARFGRADVLINNAGTALYGLFQNMTNAEWEGVRKTLDAAVYCTRSFLPGMIARRSGAIVNISSVWGVCGGSCEAGYSAAKAGLIGLTKALAKEVAPSGITVNCLAPGCIDTDMCRGLDRTLLEDDTPLGRLGTPEEVAAAAFFLAAHGFITGQILGVDGGFGL